MALELGGSTETDLGTGWERALVSIEACIPVAEKKADDDVCQRLWFVGNWVRRSGNEGIQRIVCPCHAGLQTTSMQVSTILYSDICSNDSLALRIEYPCDEVLDTVNHQCFA